MYLELKETRVINGTEVLNRYPGRAYLLTDVTQPVHDGVTLDFHGKLYAVADREGLGEMYAASRRLEESGISTFVDTFPLDSGEAFFTGYLFIEGA